MAGKKGQSGRPKKYHTEAEVKEARRVTSLNSYHRKRGRPSPIADPGPSHSTQIEPQPSASSNIIDVAPSDVDRKESTSENPVPTIGRSSRQASLQASEQVSAFIADDELLEPCNPRHVQVNHRIEDEELPDMAALRLSPVPVSDPLNDDDTNGTRQADHSPAETPAPSYCDGSDSEDSEIFFERDDDDDDDDAVLQRRQPEASTVDENSGYTRAAAHLLDACGGYCQCTEPDVPSNAAYSMAEMTEYWQGLLPEGLKNYPLDNPEVGARENDCQHIPWKSLMAGGDDGPPSLSFAKSELPSAADVEVNRRWDIDSFIAGPTTLAVHRVGFNLSYQPPYLRRITQNQRVQIGGHQVHKLKQLRLGHGVAAGGYGIECHVVFPHMKITTPGETHLSYRRQAVWFDRIILPALKHACPPDVCHHHPRSFREACHKAQVLKEHHISSGAAPMDIRYTIPSKYLDEFWTKVKLLSYSHDGDPQIPVDAFRDPTLVLSAHGLKLWTKEDTIGAVRDEFLRHLDECFTFTPDTLPDTECWVDLGVEDTPASGGPGITLLLKQQCLDAWAMKFICPDHTEHLTRVERYHWMTTRDSGSIAVELKVNNGLRAGGIAFNKAYNVNKEIFATPFKQCAPFQNSRFEALGYSQELLERWYKANDRTRSGKPCAAKRQLLLKAYCRTKKRMWFALSDSMDEHYGVRQEFRISMVLLRRLPEVAEPKSNGHRPYWVIPTRDVNGFAAAELNRWLLCLEGLIGDTAMNLVQDMQLVNGVMVSVLARIMNMHLASDPRSHHPIWREEWMPRHRGAGRATAQQKKRGLNLQASMHEHGLVWFPAQHVHWNIVPTFTDLALKTLSITNNGLQRTLRAHGNVYERLSQEDYMYQLFREQLRASPETGVKLGAELVVQRYVKQVLLLLAERGVEAHKGNLAARFAAFKAQTGLTEAEAAGLHGLSFKLIQKLTPGGAPRIATPRRGVRDREFGGLWGIKVAALFRIDSDIDFAGRKLRWHTADYRVFARRLQAIVLEEAGENARQSFIPLLYSTAFGHLWAIPHYDKDSLSLLYKASPHHHSRETQAQIRGLSLLERTKWLVPQMEMKHTAWLDLMQSCAEGEPWPEDMDINRTEVHAQLQDGLRPRTLFVYAQQDEIACIPEDPAWFGRSLELSLAVEFDEILQESEDESEQ